MIEFGNCGNLVSSNAFITTETPRFHTGFRTGLGLTLVSLDASTAVEILLFVQNRRRRAGKENMKFEASDEVLGDLGDGHPDFRYIL